MEKHKACQEGGPLPSPILPAEIHPKKFPSPENVP